MLINHEYPLAYIDADPPILNPIGYRMKHGGLIGPDALRAKGPSGASDKYWRQALLG